MNCNNCQEILGAEPESTIPEVIEHLKDCVDCQAFKAGAQNLDSILAQAMKVDVPDGLMDFDYTGKVVEFPAAKKRNPLVPFALAASVLLVVAASFLSWRSASVESWAPDLIAHIEHEPKAFAITTPVPAAKVVQVAQQNGVRMAGDFGNITYIKSCPFRGKMVTHLVAQTDRGPVTVMLLPGETVDQPEQIDEEGYVGTVLPFNGGSIVVVGSDGESAKKIQKQMSSSVTWDI